MELGCFDGRAIRYFPKEPMRYYGFDANWEGCVHKAREEFHNKRQFFFVISSSPSDLKILNRESATLALALETLEHIPPEILDEYLHQLYEVMRKNAYFIITVPNEKGIIFLYKYIIKSLIYGDAYTMTPKEFCAAVFGKTDLIERVSHKGFDYESLINLLERYYHIVKVEGVQFKYLPPKFNVTVGIICRK
ncbi:class I SAM-dependent methyltransferase [Methanothrix sp.]|uniref:class I SAM-dependent methyltransferase n=1 Tax=Methanothrix sp. TaxID=90426 RepID=UPI003C76B907